MKGGTGRGAWEFREGQVVSETSGVLFNYARGGWEYRSRGQGNGSKAAAHHAGILGLIYGTCGSLSTTKNDL